MELLTVTQVSRMLDVSTRMLRYYENEGLLESRRIEGYSYRVYTREDVNRLMQILVLRKLRIPVKDIASLLKDASCRQEVFQRKIEEIDRESDALQTIRSILQRLADRQLLLTSPEMSALTEALLPAKTNLKEEASMEDLNQAARVVDEKQDVRIIYLPPYTVASCQYVGENPEDHTGAMATKMIQKTNLYEKKPDARMFGFNHPNPGILSGGVYGYEVWVTIPDDFPLPEGFQRVMFPGGLYAVMTIRFGDFHLWGALQRWIERSDTYTIDWRGNESTMGGCLEEHLNWVRQAHLNTSDKEKTGQLDLFFPIRRK